MAVWQGVSIHIHRQYLGRPRECITEVLEARLHHTHRPFDPLRLSDVVESIVCARWSVALRRNPAGGHVYFVKISSDI